MYKDDYIMRSISDMIRMLLKLICNINVDDPSSKLVKDDDMKEELDKLLIKVNDGKICDAENRLYELIDEEDKRAMDVAFMFYAYLNEKSDDFLDENDFSREEILDGIKGIVDRYKLHGIADVLIDDIMI